MEKKTRNAIIITSVLVAGVYLLYKFLKKPPIEQENNTNATNPTLSESQFKKMADNIFEAMSGWGTNLSVIYNEMAKLRNNDDVSYLIQAYGIREVPAGKLNPVPDFGGNLPEALGNELSSSEIANLNKILSDNGITIKFNKGGNLT